MAYDPIYDEAQPLFSRTPYAEMDEKGQAFWRFMLELAGDATMVEVMAKHPSLNEFYLQTFYPRLFYNSEGDMLVSTRDKELFRYARGRKDGCVICSRGTYKILLDLGYSMAQVDSILEPTAEHFSPKELALIEYSWFFVSGRTDTLSRDLFERLREFYSEEQILELGMVGGFFMGYQRLLFGFEIGPHERDGVCSIASIAAE